MRNKTDSKMRRSFRNQWPTIFSPKNIGRLISDVSNGTNQRQRIFFGQRMLLDFFTRVQRWWRYK